MSEIPEAIEKTDSELDDKNEKEFISSQEMATILQILSLEKQNNKSTKKYSQQEIVNKLLNIVRREAENEIH